MSTIFDFYLQIGGDRQEGEEQTKKVQKKETRGESLENELSDCRFKMMIQQKRVFCGELRKKIFF